MWLHSIKHNSINKGSMIPVSHKHTCQLVNEGHRAVRSFYFIADTKPFFCNGLALPLTVFHRTEQGAARGICGEVP